MELGSSDLVASAFFLTEPSCHSVIIYFYTIYGTMPFNLGVFEHNSIKNYCHSGWSYGYYHHVLVFWIGCFCGWQLGSAVFLSLHLIVLFLGVPEAASAELSWCCIFLKVSALPFINVDNRSLIVKYAWAKYKGF